MSTRGWGILGSESQVRGEHLPVVISEDLQVAFDFEQLFPPHLPGNDRRRGRDIPLQ